MTGHTDMVAFRDHCRDQAENTLATLDALRTAGRGEPATYLEQLDRDAHLWIQLATEIDTYLDNRLTTDVDDAQADLFTDQPEEAPQP